jgi:hypothetical protein
MGAVWGITLFFHLLAGPVINEVMADPAGPEAGEGSPGDRNEYVELFNPTADAVDLAGATLVDRNESDPLIAFPGSSGTVLGPGAYALILDPEYLDPGGHDPTPYDIPEGILLLTTEDQDIGGYGLSRKDWLVLLDRSGDTLDTYGTPGDSLDDLPPPPEDGISVERRDPSGGDEEGNWRLSRFGCTPGGQNSLSMPVNLALDSTGALEPELPDPGQSAQLVVRGFNAGLSSVYSFTVVCETDLGTEEMERFETLAPDDTLSMALDIPGFSEGYWEIRVRIAHPEDTFPDDDSLSLFVHVGRPPLIINEIMYDDTCEWVELLNRSDEPLELSGFSLWDKAGTGTGPFEPVSISPGSFVVVAEDSLALFSRFGSIPWLCPPQFPTLNNSEEELRLLNREGALIEKVFYRSRFGGGDGVSLERISPELPSRIEASWAGSLDPSGGTPGRRNSVFVETRPDEDLLSISAKTFTPDGDGERDFLVVSYVLPVFPASVQVYVFDGTGRLVVPLHRGESPSGTGELVWNGTDHSGCALPTGLYIIYLEARSGRQTYKSKRTVVLSR